MSGNSVRNISEKFNNISTDTNNNKNKFPSLSLSNKISKNQYDKPKDTVIASNVSSISKDLNFKRLLEQKLQTTESGITTKEVKETEEWSQKQNNTGLSSNVSSVAKDAKFKELLGKKLHTASGSSIKQVEDAEEFPDYVNINSLVIPQEEINDIPEYCNIELLRNVPNTKTLVSSRIQEDNEEEIPEYLNINPNIGPTSSSLSKNDHKTTEDTLARSLRNALLLRSQNSPKGPKLPPRMPKTFTTVLPTNTHVEYVNIQDVSLIEPTQRKFSTQLNSAEEVEELEQEVYDYVAVVPIVPKKKHQIVDDGLSISNVPTFTNLRLQKFQSHETFDSFDSDDDWNDNPELVTNDQPLFVNTTGTAPVSLLDILNQSQVRNLTWSEIITKFQINVHDSLTNTSFNIQSAKFDLVRSEWSLLQSLNLLNDHFLSKLYIVLSKNEHEKLFANVKKVRDCSEAFLMDLNKCWHDNTFQNSFCEIICENLEANFACYVYYTASQVIAEALLGEIISNKSRTFKDFLDDLQSEPKCNNLHLHSYQLLPIKKIQNFPILINNILKYLKPSDAEYNYCVHANVLLKQILKQCNEEASKSKDHLKTKKILQTLIFPKNVLLNVNKSDHMLRRFLKTEIMDIIEMNTSLFGRKVTKKTVNVFLFNDIFVVAKKTSANKYQVLDYCFRINLEIESSVVLSLTFNNLDVNKLLYLLIKENKDLKNTEMILSCKTKAEADEWIEALDPADDM